MSSTSTASNSSQPVWRACPYAPAWTLERLVEVALGWLTSGRLRTEGIVTPVVPFEESVEAYREIDEHPERSIKLGIRFS
jgi:threonine dehydrogenase-like Zn-dependent dehydrogenase